jgi:hypothetical protein
MLTFLEGRTGISFAGGAGGCDEVEGVCWEALSALKERESIFLKKDQFSYSVALTMKKSNV